MKVQDIAQEIYRELDEPSDLTIPVIAFWIRSNVGELNNHLDTAFKINDTSLEIVWKGWSLGSTQACHFAP